MKELDQEVVREAVRSRYAGYSRGGRGNASCCCGPMDRVVADEIRDFE